MSAAHPKSCSTPCDDDCEAVCHQQHLPYWKREENHQHANGDPRIDVFAEATRQQAIDTRRGWHRLPDEQFAAGLAAIDYYAGPSAASQEPAAVSGEPGDAT